MSSSSPVTADAAAPKVFLGTVDLPSGVLLALDPGLGKYWSHDQAPAPDEWVQTDFAITGNDAVAAGEAFDRQFDPEFIFDIPEKGLVPTTDAFAALCAERGFEAALVPMESRMPHVERAHSALVAGEGLGIAQYAGVWSVVAGGFPTGTTLTAYATPMPPGEFEGRWQRIELIDESVGLTAGEEVTSREIDGVMVDYGQFIFSDLKAFGEFRMWKSLDGLGDFVFWGVDAPALAEEMKATEVEEQLYGWKNVPMEELKALVRPVTKAIEERELRVAQDYRPHCNLEKLNAQVRSTKTETGTLTLAGSHVLGMRNSWGDGIFAVTCHYNAAGRPVRVSMELGTEKRCRLLRQVMLSSCLAFVSKSVTRDAERLHFGERDEPRGRGDSGWFFHSGTESDEEANDAEHYQAMRLGDLIDQTPGLKMCLDLPPGSLIRWDGEGYVVEEVPGDR
jgi:hypothetical protein